MQKTILALLATIFLMSATTDADGFGGLFRSRSNYYSSYYYGSYYPSYYYSGYYSPSYYSGYYPSYYSSYYYPSYYYSSDYYTPSVSYSYYVPTYYYTAPALACSSTVAVPVVNVANPTPAPASTNEPPTKSKRVPNVEDNTKEQTKVSNYSMFASTNSAKQSVDQVRVGFWNLTDTDYQLRVDGQVHTLKRNKGVSLTLDREFVWQLNQRKSVREVIPQSESSSEILIRD